MKLNVRIVLYYPTLLLLDIVSVPGDADYFHMAMLPGKLYGPDGVFYRILLQ